MQRWPRLSMCDTDMCVRAHVLYSQLCIHYVCEHVELFYMGFLACALAPHKRLLGAPHKRLLRT